MTSGDITAASLSKENSPFQEQPLTPREEWWLKIEHLLDRSGDWLNPILVKETRQALKSKQFSITFSLLLLLGWFWTALFVVFTIPTIYHVPLGTYVLGGYLFVLTIPMLIVVPYAAFRSLAAEREDGTFELLSITTLAARQIVLGKLGSAVVQMIVYYSALAPCIAFTYLLRGLDILTIAHVLGYTFLASLALSAIGLMLATTTRSRHWQLLLSVVFVMALLVAAVLWFILICSLLAVPASMYDQWQFWLAELCSLTFYVSYVALFLQLAAGQISFASENRSTSVRWILFAQQLLIIGWGTCFVQASWEEELVMVTIVGTVLHWILAGIFLTGEQAKLSPRALRDLPQSLLGRMFLTWFNPGGVTGYLFATTSVLGTLAFLSLFILACDWLTPRHFPWNEDEWYIMLAVVSYFCFYLGLSRLVVVGMTKLGTTHSMLLNVLVQVMMAFLVCLMPLLGNSVMHNWQTGGPVYDLWQLPNWMWTLERIGSGHFRSDPLPIFFLVLCGLGMYLFHLLLAAPETAKKKLAAPARVQAEDSSLPKTTKMFEM